MFLIKFYSKTFSYKILLTSTGRIFDIFLIQRLKRSLYEVNVYIIFNFSFFIFKNKSRLYL